MKKYYLIILQLLLCLSIYAEKHSFLEIQTTASTSIPKVIKEDKKEESESSKYGSRTKYQITYADGTTGKLYQAKSDGQWWGSALYMDKGPFTKSDALKWLYGYEQKKNAVKTGAVVAAGAVVLHQATKSTPKTSINLSNIKKPSINLFKRK